MSSMLAMLGLSGGELILVLVAVLVLFGAKKIPDFAKGLGQGIKEFKKASREVQDEFDRVTSDINNPTPPPPPVASRPTPTPAPEAVAQTASAPDTTSPASEAKS